MKIKKNKIPEICFYLILICIFGWSPYSSAKEATRLAQGTAPERILFLVFDQMRPDYIERFNLKNFKRLQKLGTNYKNAYVGNSASVTIVSHIVMTTGLLPKDLPWSDGLIWDKNGVFGVPDAVVTTTEASHEQLMKAASTVPASNFLIHELKKKLKGSFFAVGQKHYSTTVMGGPFSDSIIFMSHKNEKGDCVPEGFNVPKFISENERYKIDCKSTYGTEESLYVLDGNRFYPGNDSKHLGGDVWIADIALDLMKNNPNWSGLFLTFGAIDRFGHMLGETDGMNPLSFAPPAHLKDIAHIADAQLGRLLDELESKKLLDKTLILVTADHGAQTDTVYLGAGGGKSDPFWLGRLGKYADIRAIESNTCVRLWIRNYDSNSKEKILNHLKEISKVTRIYSLEKTTQKSEKKEDMKYRYHEEYSNVASESKAFQKWANDHDQELVDTMANEMAPQFIVLFADGVGFGKLGDHGGNQEKVQRIPLIISGRSKKAKQEAMPERLVDVKGLILKEFGLE